MNIRQKYIVNNPSYKKNLNPGGDERYLVFQSRGPEKLMLHSVGCAQPSAEHFANSWNRETCEASVQAVIDANSGEIIQTMPWNFRAWHCAGLANNTHVGVEMCESKYIKYTSGAKFEILDRTKAVQDCMRTYHAAVDLFAFLCKLYKINPLTGICSHKEGGLAGIASGHVDPEHYWKGLSMNYSMDGFRADVKSKMEDVLEDMTRAELDAYLDEKLAAQKRQFEERVRQIADSLSDDFDAAIREASAAMNGVAEAAVTRRLGHQVERLDDCPKDGVYYNLKSMLDENFINGGTPREIDPYDVHLPYAIIRAMTVMKSYVDTKLRALLESEEPESECGETCPIVFPDEEGIPGGGDH